MKRKQKRNHRKKKQHLSHQRPTNEQKKQKEQKRKEAQCLETLLIYIQKNNYHQLEQILPTEEMKQVINHHSKKENTCPLQAALCSKNFPILKLLIKNGANINQPVPHPMFTTLSILPIDLACQLDIAYIRSDAEQRNTMSLTRQLICSGANPFENEEQWTKIKEMLKTGVVFKKEDLTTIQKGIKELVVSSYQMRYPDEKKSTKKFVSDVISGYQYCDNQIRRNNYIITSANRSFH